MNTVTSKISMDLLTAPAELPEIHAVQGEYGTRAVQLSLFCGGSSWHIPEGVVLAVRYGKIGQGGGYYDTLPDGSCAYSCEGNTVEIVLAPQMMNTAGIVFVQVEMIDGEQVLTTFSFKVKVAVNPAVGIVEPEEYINWKRWIEQELDTYVEKVNQSGQILGGTVTGSVNMNGNAITGLQTPVGDDHAVNRGYLNYWIRKAAPRNLLDNSDFRNPVNQRGLSSYTGGGYGLDRWYVADGNGSDNFHVIIDSGYVRFYNGNANGEMGIEQRFPYGTFDINKYYTLAWKDGYGNIEVRKATISSYEQYGMDVFCFPEIPAGGTLSLVWAALYEGEYTVETVPEYRAKGYTEELEICRRYFNQMSEWSQAGVGVVSWDGACANIVVPVGALMTGNISVSGGTPDAYLRINGQSIDCRNATFTARAAGANLILQVAVDGLSAFVNQLAEFDVGSVPMQFSAEQL